MRRYINYINNNDKYGDTLIECYAIYDWFRTIYQIKKKATKIITTNIFAEAFGV